MLQRTPSSDLPLSSSSNASPEMWQIVPSCSLAITPCSMNWLVGRGAVAAAVRYSTVHSRRAPRSCVTAESHGTEATHTDHTTETENLSEWFPCNRDRKAPRDTRNPDIKVQCALGRCTPTWDTPALGPRGAPRVHTLPVPQYGPATNRFDSPRARVRSLLNRSCARAPPLAQPPPA